MVSHVTVWKWRWKARGNEFLGFYTCLCIGMGKDGIYISILFCLFCFFTEDSSISRSTALRGANA